MVFVIGSPKYGKHDVLIDDEDWIIVKEYRWRISVKEKGKKIYVRSGDGKRTKSLMLHRLITNCPSDMVVDHINNNGLDNRKENLRICNIKENAMNRRKSVLNTSGYKGVHWEKKSKKWRARLQLNGELIHLGMYTNVIEAANAYNTGASLYFGEYASLNKIEGQE